jgi:stearoyl-CoA desaturase (Delta-9 desaturase)
LTFAPLTSFWGKKMALKNVQAVKKGGIDPTTKPHISELPFTFTNWHKHINWLNTNTVIVLPIIGLIASFYTPLRRETLFAAIAYYFITGLGITAGASFLSSLRI